MMDFFANYDVLRIISELSVVVTTWDLDKNVGDKRTTFDT
jgi:hypothetical protein